MSKTVNSKILVRRDTSSNWSTNNPILAAGEIGFDTTVGKHKIGDGSTAWNSLPYFLLETEATQETDANVIAMLANFGLNTTTQLQPATIGTTTAGASVLKL